jgi:hypothetical protein
MADIRIRFRCHLETGGNETVVLRHVADREADMDPLRRKVDALLRMGWEWQVVRIARP